MNPKVSIIIPFYNAQATLDRSLTGLLTQTYTNLEIIYIDDGSTDRSLEVVEGISAGDERVKIIRKKNTGVSSSRNVGLENATGEWIYFADADDWMVRDCIETLVKGAEALNCDMVVSDFARVRSGLVSHKHGPAGGLFTQKQFLRYMGRRPSDHYFSSLWNKLFRRSIIEQEYLRFDTSISFGEDHVFILRYLRSVRNVMLVDRPLYYYIDTEGSLLHRGLNIPGVIKMKWDTYWPYLRLYNESGLYRGITGRPRVYKFIFMPTLDHFVDKGDAPFDPKQILGERTPEE